MTNKRIRIALMQAGMTQTQLAELLNIPTGEMSIMLKYELAIKEQNNIVARIKEHDARRRANA